MYYTTSSTPSYVNYFDMGNGQALPVFASVIELSSTQSGRAGAVE